LSDKISFFPTTWKRVKDKFFSEKLNFNSSATKKQLEITSVESQLTGTALPSRERRKEPLEKNNFR